MALTEHDVNGPDAGAAHRSTDGVGLRSDRVPAAAATTARAEATPAEQLAEELARRTAEIVGLAEAALVEADPDGYAHALDLISSIKHPHRRHQARLRTIERGFSHRLPGEPAVTAQLMMASLSALADWLEEEPREPSLLGYAGVLSVELGIYREAEALLAAAMRLSSGLPGIDETMKVARTRRRAKLAVPGIPADVRSQLPKLRPRLLKIAARARPAEGLTLSLCMIVRDEEEMLPRCLDAVKDGVDEIVIVDTGSRDRTVEIAESYGARVLHHTWTGDFGSARNVGMDAATGDWLLIVDADEVLVADDALRLRELTGRTWREAFYLVEINHTGELDDGTAAKHSALRMIRNRPEYRYVGTVHEQLAYQLPGYLPERLESTDIRMDHFGYLGAVRAEKGKTDRNLPLLLEQLEAGDDSAFLHFNLGSEYAGVDTDGKSLYHFRRAWELAVDDPQFTLGGFVPSLAARYVRALRVDEDWEGIDAAAAIIHERLPGFTDVYFEQALGAAKRGETEEARRLFEHCVELGDAPAKYSSTVGCGSYLAEMRLAQLEMEADDGEAAETRLRRICQQHPNYFGVIDPFATLLLIRGASPDEVLAELTEENLELSPSGWFMVAINLQERGHREQAELAFRGALERRPAFDAARVALADALLVQGRIEEAIAEARQVPADTRVGPSAVRLVLFALLALDDGDDLGAQRVAALKRLDDAELDPSEVAVLRAWAAKRMGTGELFVLAPDDVSAMTPMMDALLRLGAADAFADLIGLLPTTGVDRRTQHEILATQLLSRGLPELAADEWIAAVQEDGPDAAAYAGLAEVARVQGLLEDARTLAAEALALDPGHELAGRVLDAVSS